MEPLVKYRDGLKKAFEFGEMSHRKRLIQLTISGRVWSFYDNLNLYIIPSLACNASCRDCVGKYSPDSLNGALSEEAYLIRLEQVLSMLVPLNPSISIVGGEPSIDQKLPRILRLLKEKSIRKPILDTNVTGLLSPDLLNAINQSSLEHINISRRHYNEDRNQELMRITPALTNRNLKEILAMLNPQIQVRFQTCLDKNGIKDLDDCIEYIRWAFQLGASSIAIAEHAFLPSEFLYSQEVVNYTNANRIPLNAILSEVDNNPLFRLQKQIIGPHYYEEVYSFNGRPVTFKIADYTQERKDFIDYLVFHADGRLTASWDNKELSLIP